MEILNQGSFPIEVFLQNSFPSPQKNSFLGFEGENPYNHLRSFEQLCSTRSYSDLSPDEFRVRLFPFSLAGKSKCVVLLAREGSHHGFEEFAWQVLI
jgi:hypothetical protein